MHWGSDRQPAGADPDPRRRRAQAPPHRSGRRPPRDAADRPTAAPTHRTRWRRRYRALEKRIGSAARRLWRDLGVRQFSARRRPMTPRGSLRRSARRQRIQLLHAYRPWLAGQGGLAGTRRPAPGRHDRPRRTAARAGSPWRTGPVRASLCLAAPPARHWPRSRPPHGAPIALASPGDRRHHRIVAKPARVVFHLLLEVAGVQPNQPGRGVAVAGPVQAVAGEAGVARAGPPPPLRRPVRPAALSAPAVGVVGRAQAARATRLRAEERETHAQRLNTRRLRSRFPGTAWPRGRVEPASGFGAADGVTADGSENGGWPGDDQLGGAGGLRREERPPRDLAGADPGRARDHRTPRLRACHQIPGVEWPAANGRRSLAGFADAP
jgi:hypothetical protein